MSGKLKLFLFFTIILFLLYSCSSKWQKTIQYGSLQNESFNEQVNIEVKNGLIIIPVVINGKTYRFLFDSGAPLSISEKLQSQFEYKTISKGHIVDSDKNRQKIIYVQLDTISIGDIPFMDQTALVINFEANPYIACLGLDGIIGSNLMRFCNWQINYQDSLITLSNSTIMLPTGNTVAIPFTTDNQYDMNIDLQFGESTITNMKIDYGSTGSISLTKNIFNTLKQKGTFGDIFHETGTTQSGIIGNSININRQITFLDTIKAGKLKIDNVRIRTGKSALIGKKILSRYVVTIDWENKQLYMVAVDMGDNDQKTFGVGVGYFADKKIVVRSVVENSIAWHKGIKPNMQILRVNSLDFTKTHNFCDYMNYINVEPDTIDLVLKDNNGEIKHVVLEKQLLVIEE